MLCGTCCVLVPAICCFVLHRLLSQLTNLSYVSAEMVTNVCQPQLYIADMAGPCATSMRSRPADPHKANS